MIDRQLQGKHNVYYCGAWAIEGMGLLEEGVRGSERVAERIVEDIVAG